MISFQAYLAEAVEDQLRGRVYATFDALTWLGTAGAFSLLGVVTPMLGAPGMPPDTGGRSGTQSRN